MDKQMPDPTQFSREELIVFCRAVANVIAADHKITGEERHELFALVREAGLSPHDADVQSTIDAELSTPTPIESIVKNLTNPVLRRNLFRTLIEVALVDGLAPQEEERLVKLAQVFELNSTAARELIQWTLDSLAMEKREDEILRRL